MKTARLFLSLCCGLSLFCLPGSWAQPTAPTAPAPSGSSSPARPPAPPGSDPAASAGAPGVLLSTATLLGREVRNPQGEHLGDLEHLLIDPQTGRVMYAVITMGGVLGVGSKTLQVPWETLQVAQDGKTVVLHAAQPLMPQAPPAEDKPPSAPAR